VPDRRTKVQAPPQQIKINQHAPGADARRARVQKSLTEWMRAELKRSELGERYTLSDKPLTAAEIPAVAKAVNGG
jgi:hypothetical protein